MPVCPAVHCAAGGPARGTHRQALHLRHLAGAAAFVARFAAHALLQPLAPGAASVCCQYASTQPQPGSQSPCAMQQPVTGPSATRSPVGWPWARRHAQPQRCNWLAPPRAAAPLPKQSQRRRGRRPAARGQAQQRRDVSACVDYAKHVGPTQQGLSVQHGVDRHHRTVNRHLHAQPHRRLCRRCVAVPAAARAGVWRGAARRRSGRKLPAPRRPRAGGRAAACSTAAACIGRWAARPPETRLGRGATALRGLQQQPTACVAAAAAGLAAYAAAAGAAVGCLACGWRCAVRPL